MLQPLNLNTHHNRAEAEALFQLFDEHFNEVEQDGQTALGKQKHWRSTSLPVSGRFWECLLDNEAFIA